jgi:hypothetical protein
LSPPGVVPEELPFAQLAAPKVILDEPVDPDAIGGIGGAFEDFDVSGSQLVRSSHCR